MPVDQGMMEGVNAVAGMVAALASVVAVFLAVREARAGRNERAADREQGLYQRVVLDPLQLALDTFVRQASQLIEQQCAEIASLDSSILSHTEVVKACGRAIGSFNGEFFRAKTVIRRCGMAWGDEELSKRADEAMQDLQDDVVPLMASLTTANPPSDATIVGKLSDGVARLLQVLIRYNPEKRQLGVDALRGTAPARSGPNPHLPRL